MKKLLYILSFAALAFVGCSEDLILDEDGNLGDLNPNPGGTPGDNPYWDWADRFPGPISKDLTREENVVVDIKSAPTSYSFDSTSNILHSTDLYVPQNEYVTINVPEGVTNLNYAIGIHVNTLAPEQVKYRYENVSSNGKLNPGENKIMSWFGGILYVYFDKSDVMPAPVSLTIDKAVALNSFKYREENWEEWRNEHLSQMGYDTIVTGSDTSYVAKQGIPWTELKSDKVILTIKVNDLIHVQKQGIEENLDLLMSEYEKFIDTYYEVYNIDASNFPPLRVTSDLQIPNPNQTPSKPGNGQGGIWYTSTYPITYIRGLDDTKVVDETRLLDYDLLSLQTSPKFGKGWNGFSDCFNAMFARRWNRVGQLKTPSNRMSQYYYTHKQGRWPHKVINFLNTINDQNNKEITDNRFWIKRGDDAKLAMFMQLINEGGWGLLPYLHSQSDTYLHDTVSIQNKNDYFAMAASEYLDRDLTPFFETWRFYVSTEAQHYMKNFTTNQDSFWLHFDPLMIPTFEKREANHSFRPMPEPGVLVRHDKTGWSISAVKINPVTGARAAEPAVKVAKMIDQNLNMYYDSSLLNFSTKAGKDYGKCNPPSIRMPYVAFGTIELTIDCKQNYDINTVIWKNGNNFRNAQQMVDVSVWNETTSKWQKVNPRIIPMLAATNQPDQLFYLGETYNTSKMKISVKPIPQNTTGNKPTGWSIIKAAEIDFAYMSQNNIVSNTL